MKKNRKEPNYLIVMIYKGCHAVTIKKQINLDYFRNVETTTGLKIHKAQMEQLIYILPNCLMNIRQAFMVKDLHQINCFQGGN
ncbi:hypothetical protein ACIQWI_01845 [Peribacillus frigoritolerans]